MARGASSTTSSVKLSRWRPTPEQLMVLQDLFMRKGVKTPTAQQIQRITQQLMQFGKVETKNVFYWFQNHKAREKQKLRKRLLNCYYYFQHGHHGEDEQQQKMSNVFYYCLPPHSHGFLPFNIPAAGQMMRTSNSSNDQVLENTPSSDRTSCSTDLNPCNGVNAATHHDYKDRGLSPPEECVINLMNDDVVKDSTPPLKTLQLFPTTTSSNITTTATETPTVQDPCVLASATSSPTFLSLFMSSYELDI